MVRAIPGQRRGTGRLARVLGLDGNPLRRASDRAEAWIRVGLLAIFLIAGPPAALGAGHWAYHAGISGARVQAPAHRVQVKPVPFAVGLSRVSEARQPWARSRSGNAGASAPTCEVLAAVVTLALMAFALLTVLRLALGFLSRRRLTAWETAWSRVGPQWTGGKS